MTKLLDLIFQVRVALHLTSMRITWSEAGAEYAPINAEYHDADDYDLDPDWWFVGTGSGGR
jgi:hypothetical protein